MAWAWLGQIKVCAWGLEFYRNDKAVIGTREFPKSCIRDTLD
jgi:hypothetical protein